MFLNARESQGFSILELVIAIVVIGILLTIAVPRLFDDKGSRLAMAAKMICSDIAAVQRMAVYEGKAIEIAFDEDGYSVQRVDSGEDVTYGERFPVTGLSENLGVAIETEGSLTFNSLGEPISDSLENITVYVVSDPSSTQEIVIERETGHAQVE
jgi:prepilin-type N-terminal cleavage/methylation domain-containing protein